MPQLQFTGPIGPFADHVQRRAVPVTVTGTLELAQPVDPAWGHNQILTAVNAVISHKMGTGALQFRNLGEGNLLGAEQEILQVAGFPPASGLQLAFGIDNHPPVQREIRANIRVGGLRIKASSNGGVDVGHLGDQLVAKAKSALFWYVGFGLLTLLIIGGVVLYLAHTVKGALDKPSPMAAAAAAASHWDGKSPLACSGAEVVKVEGVTAKLAGTAVTASGACQLTLVDCTITGTEAIEAIGGASVTVTGGSITGSEAAVKAIGSASVKLAGTKVTGKLAKLGAATITGP